MRFVYHLITIGVCVHYANLARVPLCFSVYSCLLPSVLFAVSYLLFRRLIFSNPGIAKRSDEETAESACRICHRIKSKTTRHCRICDICVDGFDHHCNILNICIGAGNIKCFRFFLFVHAILLACAGFHTYRLIVQCASQDHRALRKFFVLLLFEACFAIVFFMFWTFHVLRDACSVTYNLLSRFFPSRKSALD